MNFLFLNILVVLLIISFDKVDLYIHDDSLDAVLKPHIENDEIAENHWRNYKKIYNKTYITNLHEQKARKAWKNNLNAVKFHNSLNHSYRLSANHLSDMTLRQYLRNIVKLVNVDSNHTKSDILPDHLKYHNSEIPHEMDWRKFGFQPLVPSQRRCGACYAFSVAHALQAQLLISHKIWKPLSEQQIIDCSGNWGNYGCGGGSLRGALRYLESYGAMSFVDYPYEARKGKCRWKKYRVTAKLTSWGLSPRGDESTLQRLVALLGPVPASLNAAPQTFQLYHSGIYDDPMCTNKSLNHAVLIVGYTRTHWIILNWWGKHWGENGYMRLRKGKNRCGITNYATYVIMNDNNK